MVTIDALSFPHVIDEVLFQLHLDRQYRTLANFRLTCSTFKEAINLRLSRHKILAQQAPDQAPASGALEARQPLYLDGETRLWSARTDGWARNPIEQVVDIHVVNEGSCHGEPCDIGRVPILRIFDCPGLPQPCSADTVIIFPSPGFFSAPASHSHYIELPPDANRIVINMRYDSVGGGEDRPTDFEFGYAVAKAHGYAEYLLNDDVQRPQVLVLMFSPSSCGVAEDPTWYLQEWTRSLAHAVCHNLYLNVILLAEHWSWTWFADGDDEDHGDEPDYEWLLRIPDEHRRLQVAWRSLLWEFISQVPHVNAEECVARIQVQTMAEYEARVGSRLFQLMQVE